MITGQLFLDKAKWIMGWMSVEELSFLAETARELKSGSVVYEIGSFCGRSSRAIADNAPDDCKIYCIDPWNFKIPTLTGETIIVDETTLEQFRVNLWDHILTGKVTPLIMRWENFTSTEKADFIFLDGNHSYGAIEHDISKALEYIKPDGIIAGHDYQNFPDVYKAVNEFFRSSDIRTKGSIWWTRKF
jgi:predicted O-methyltransferase YrrM